ncbi:MAG: hypothetical protein AAFZ52_14125 [Bacteroidota bacterium]
MTSPKTRNLSIIAWCTIALIALAYTYVYYHRTLNGPFRFNDDVAQHYLWLFGEYYDADWQDGFYARASAALQPWGYYLLLKFCGWFIDPLTISRYGVFALALGTVGYATALFRRFVPVALAVGAGLVVFHYSLLITTGFLARGFMIPLLLAFGYYLVLGERPWQLGGTLVVSALFYPPALVINLTILGLFSLAELLFSHCGCLRWWARSQVRRKVPPEKRTKLPLRSWGIYAGSAVLSLLLIWLHSRGVKASPELGDFLPRETLLNAPEFSAQGRVAVTNVMNTDLGFFIRYFTDRYLPSDFAPHFGRIVLFLALAAGLFHWRQLGRLTGWAAALAATTLLLFLFAQAVFPLLFLPDRFIVYPWLLLTGVVLFLVTAGIYRLYPRPWLSTLLVVLLLSYAHYNRDPQGFGFVGLDDADKYEFYDAIRALPPEANIVAPPEVASWFPAMAQRMPFLSTETAHALYFSRYHDYVMPRFADYAEAISTRGDDLEPVRDFMDKWELDYLLIDVEKLRRRQHDLWAPHKAVFEASKDQLGPGELFTLEKIPEDVGVWIRKRHRILSRNDLNLTLKQTISE